jgi:hypothetical protein
MLYLNSWSLHGAIYQKLKNDAPLAALVTGVYDKVPESAEYPYIALGPGEMSFWRSMGSAGINHRQFVNIYSRYEGHKEALAILDRVIAVLNKADLTVEHATLVDIAFDRCRLMSEPGAETRHLQVEFSVITQNELA